MKRGVLFALAFGVVSAVWWNTQYAIEPVQSGVVFDFAKQDVVGFRVNHPNGASLQVEEVNGEWVLSDSGYSASMTMVNRVRHQLHQLPVRAVVSNHDSDLSVYGLGQDATVVSVQLRSGSVSFEVGAPNPTGVSYYIRPLTGPLAKQVLTVAKASVDYFEAESSEFRSPHFCRFDVDAVTEIQIVHPKEGTWSLRQTVQESKERWTATQPDGIEIAASKDVAHRILGRLIALKASEYVGQMDPRWSEVEASTTMVVLSRIQETPLRIRIGSSDWDGQSLFLLNDASEAALARNGVLDDLRFDAVKVRDPLVLSRIVAGSDALSVQGSGVFVGSIRTNAGEVMLNDAPLDTQQGVELLRQIEELRGFFIDNDVEMGAVQGHLQMETDSGTWILSVGSVQTLPDIQDSQPLETQQYRLASLQPSIGEPILFRVEEIWVQQLIRLFSP